MNIDANLSELWYLTARESSKHIPIILMDEATVSLDIENELLIIDKKYASMWNAKQELLVN